MPERDPNPPLAHGSGDALWSQIERQLAADIGAGRVRPGERLPPEHALAERFAVNRHTVRQALGALAARGLVRVAHGRGTFVAEFAVDYTLGRRTRFSENLAAAGVTGRHRLLEASLVEADARLAAALELRRGAKLARLLTLGEARGRPLSVSEHYFPARRFPGLAERFRTEGSLSKALAGYGAGDYQRRKSVLSARLPDEDIARLLAQPATRPVLCIEAVNVDRAGRPIEWQRTLFAGDRLQVVVESGR